MINLMMIWQALRSGWQLKKSGTWKNIGALISLATPVVFYLSKWAASHGWIPAEVSQDELDQFQQWLLAGSGMATAYWFRATSVNVGWGARSASAPVYRTQAFQDGGVTGYGSGMAEVGAYQQPVVVPPGVLNRPGGYRAVQGVSNASAFTRPAGGGVPGFEDLDRINAGAG